MKAMTNLDSVLKCRDVTLLTRVHVAKAMIFPVVMYRCESWTIEKTVPKNWCFQTVVLEKTLESPLDFKEIKPVNPVGNQPGIFIGRTDTEAEAPIFWPPGVKSWFIGKDPDAGKYQRQKEKGVTEDETFGGHHQINGHEYEQTMGDNEGQGSLVCCSPCGCKDFNTTERLNNNNNNNFCNIRGCRNFKFLWTLVETENNLLLNTVVVIWQEMET